jgi:predicted Zn-dependent protease
MIRSSIFWVLVLVGLVGLVGCASDKSVISQSNDAHRQLEPAVVEDAVLKQYVQAVGDRVVVAAREMAQEGYEEKRLFSQDPSWMFEGVQFHLVSSKTLNAFTTGGQHVYLYTELMRTAKTEDEFAAVVAHEFAHIFGRHVHNGMNRQYAIIGTAVATGVGGYALGNDDNRTELALALGGGALVAGQFVGMGFSRNDENEADKFGFRFYTRAGWDPDRFGDFFQQMVDKGMDTTPEFASSHPRLADRVDNAKRRATEYKQNTPGWSSRRKANVAGPARFAELQNRALSVSKSMPDDDTLKVAKLMLDSFPSCVAPTAQPSQTRARNQLGELLQESR